MITEFKNIKIEYRFFKLQKFGKFGFMFDRNPSYIMQKYFAFDLGMIFWGFWLIVERRKQNDFN